MSGADDLPEELIARMRDGDQQALAEVFSFYRQRLRRIVSFRLDYRIAARLSDSDVLQESFLAAAKRLEHFSRGDEMSPFLWLRWVTQQQLVDLQRQHIVAEKRDVRREISIAGKQQGSAATSLAIAAHLVGRNRTASQILQQAEQIARLEATLNEMDDLDREVIALRHFEELSNVETAKVLQIDPSAASKRYIRAMKRLAKLIEQLDEVERG